MSTPTIDGLTVVGFNPIMLKGDKGDPGSGIDPATLATLVTSTQLAAAIAAIPSSGGSVVADGGTATSISTITYDGGHA